MASISAKCSTTSSRRSPASAFIRAIRGVGGLLFDVDDDVHSPRSAPSSRTFPKTHADLCRLLNRNRIFIDRTRGIGVLSKEQAINLSCTGPIARASGVVRDLRKDEPYLAYKDFGTFKVVCSAEGDCYARYLVRMEEMLESLKIVAAASSKICRPGR